ncbi:hypothetical protein GCM10025860_14210 [Methanobacterium ferruginis]|nr:hypothetical protein GCM10025860_14210 [Methanobacterium ferruginis]
MIGLAKPITAFSKLVTPIIGWMKSIISEVTARCTVSVAHIITANTNSAIAACPGSLNPGVGTNITMIKAIIANGIPHFLKLSIL